MKNDKILLCKKCLDNGDYFMLLYQKNEVTNDIEFVNEFLLILDKILPPEDENVLLFSNEYDYPTKKVYTNDQKAKIPKFPVERFSK